MPLTSGQTTVGTVAVQIDGASHNPSFLHIHNDDNTKSVYLGGSNVGTADGLNLQKLDSIEINLFPGNSIYAISTSNNHTISWLRQTI